MAGEAGQPTQLLKKLGGADLTAVPEVRHALRAMLRKWGGPGASDVAELLTSELVTNALIHTEQGAVVTATVVPDGLRVEVRDYVSGLAGLPGPHVPIADDGTHGRGLVLVQALADSWGVEDHGVGKVVWFELDGGAA
ncbi:ATP-binding protein [Streptomyces sp. ms191]|uniref:ATP-binding protein n=2 Tax=unclassified Streptomyces TaxID=2593676 RepID=UPI0011CE499E|nr:ATP-binding protein [Streptomyces sp. ms191]TXS21443.1 ATP-binding protein [Streptomyces sp. ms191]